MQSRAGKIAIVVGAVAMAFSAVALVTSAPTNLLARVLTEGAKPQTADVVIVLGGGTQSHGDPLPPQVKERIQKGAELFKNGFSGSMIVTGGLDVKTGYVEADLMRAYAESMGVPSNAIIEERVSRDTLENALLSASIMKERGWSSALVVTSAYHTRRACRMFRRVTDSVVCSAAPFTSLSTSSVAERFVALRYVVREFGAIAWYIVRGVWW